MSKLRFSALSGLLTGWLLSFRVLTALATSVSVTAAVSVPLGYQAAKARDEVVAAAPATTTTVPGVVAPGDDPAPPPGPTTTTTTSTTVPGPSTTVGVVIPANATIPPGPTTSLPALTSTGLFASVSPDHSKPAILDRATLIRRIWVFFDGPGVESVSYWLDQPDGTGKPTATADGPPFDLAPEGFDFDDLDEGLHSLLAEVTTPTGRSRRLAVFEVVH